MGRWEGIVKEFVRENVWLLKSSDDIFSPL